MTDPVPSRPPRPTSSGGGIFIAIGIVGGIIVGVATGEVTVAVLAGLGLGVLAALLLWWRNH
ncbi:hypothetical protein [Sphingomonas paucimobilis]|uniref:hypothetical protein n=1 Tax=Sphingomonas paucimobilis TaxID=13689 RepID=UPI0028D15EC2|nr:hypothetical protein [Sphingomonas paucimobilis]